MKPAKEEGTNAPTQDDAWSDGAVSVKEARRLLGDIARSGVYRLIADGRLVTAKLGRRRVVARRSVVSLLEELAGDTESPNSDRCLRDPDADNT